MWKNRSRIQDQLDKLNKQSKSSKIVFSNRTAKHSI